jgi:lysophospholipase
MFGIRTGSWPALIGRALAFGHARLGRADRYLFDQPGDPLGGPFETNRLTHDPARYARNAAQAAADQRLTLGSPTWGWLDFAFEATGWLSRAPGVASIPIPVIVMGAEKEALVDNDAQRRITARMPKGRWLEAPGAYHEILQEIDPIRAVFWQAFDALIESLKPT